MAFFISSVKHCFGRDLTKGYDPIKKDDDLGVEEIQSWLAAHPIDRALPNRESEQIRTYICSLTRDLPNKKISSATVELVKNHLVKIAQNSIRARKYLLEETNRIAIPEPFGQTITLSIISTDPQRA